MPLDFIVKTELVERATRAIYRYIPQLEAEDVYEILDKVSKLQEGVGFSEEGSLQLDLTDIQLVAFAAALAAAGEILTSGE